ncbi:DUF5671 domain-containing protein [Microbacterium sp. cf046]|uniref:DUF5671 domain-containing protein n=1 Tax=Microbacterium sp. cf046 TaxID=1761803 RepID=UPI000A788516|nr:DUF5671 domain-containing protein [Microbacterium sp. cf046]
MTIPDGPQADPGAVTPAESGSPGSTGPGSLGRAQTVVRRIIVFVILFALVVIAAIGLSGLIERVIGAGSALIVDDSGLARSLAFTLIAGPLAGLLWWWQRRRLADPAERASLVWALYLTAMSLTSLIVATVDLASAAAAGIDGQWRPADVATGVVWLGVWFWHRHMRRSAATAPTRLVGVPDQLSALYGLVVAASGAIAVIAQLVSRALIDPALVLVSSQSWVISALQALAWCAIGALVWWWHWFRERASHAPGAFSAVILVVVVGAAAATTLFAIATILFAVLRVLFDSAPLAEVLSELDVAIAAGLIGAIVWAYHAQVLTGRSAQVRSAGRLVVSAIALIGAASGFGVVVNALLATFGDTLVDDDPRTLLLGGISALVVGAPTWWLAWRPTRAVAADEAADPARRVYLVAVFGASAIVAIVAVLIIGYRLFEFGLDAGGASGLVERIRAPLGVLTATAVVFAYHFTIWRRDRSLAGTIARRQTIGRLILVTAGDADGLAGALHTETGATVSVWRSADPTALLRETDLPALQEALAGVTAPRVLVIPEAGGGVRVVPLAD